MKATRTIAFLAAIGAMAPIGTAQKLYAQSDYNKALCVSDQKREELCALTVTKLSITVKYPTGRTAIIKSNRINNLTRIDESTKSGFIFKRLNRRYTYKIDFTNADNDGEQLAIAFDDASLDAEFQRLMSKNQVRP